MNADGSPNLLTPTASTAPSQLATSDSPGLQFTKTGPTWGIFLDNASIFPANLEPDTILALDYRREWTVADFQIEKGSFSSYDKVQRPFDVRVRLAKSGSESLLTQFVASIEDLGDSLELVDVVTPTRTYLGVTLTSIGYQQSAKNGISMITFDLGLREIRETAASAMTAAIVQDPGSADPTNGGTVQAQAPTPAVALAAKAAVKRALAPASAAGAPTS